MLIYYLGKIRFMLSFVVKFYFNDCAWVLIYLNELHLVVVPLQGFLCTRVKTFLNNPTILWSPFTRHCFSIHLSQLLCVKCTFICTFLHTRMCACIWSTKACMLTFTISFLSWGNIAGWFDFTEPISRNITIYQGIVVVNMSTDKENQSIREIYVIVILV